MTDETANIEWGKEWKWGIIKRPLQYTDSRGRKQLPYAVVENMVAKFAAESRRTAVDLSYDEAVALCTILNAGGNNV